MIFLFPKAVQGKFITVVIFFNENILKNVSLTTGGKYYKLESIPQLKTC